jgi:hypothetical protein
MFHSSMVCSVSSKAFSETSSAFAKKLIAVLSPHSPWEAAERFPLTHGSQYPRTLLHRR